MQQPQINSSSKGTAAAKKQQRQQRQQRQSQQLQPLQQSQQPLPPQQASKQSAAEAAEAGAAAAAASICCCSTQSWTIVISVLENCNWVVMNLILVFLMCLCNMYVIPESISRNDLRLKGCDFLTIAIFAALLFISCCMMSFFYHCASAQGRRSGRSA